jgi:multidrug efflux pump subunit AcrA (membrane-fusion protein)
MKLKSLLGEIFLVLISGLIVFNGCSANNKGDENSAQDSASPLVTVKAVPVMKETLDETVPAYGVTSVQQLYRIISPVTGVITGFKFFNGDRVIKGEIIATIMTREAYAAIKGAETMIGNAVTDEQKNEALRTLKIARKSSNPVKITAPFSGIIVNRIKNENEIVSEGEIIAGLINKNSICFIAQVPADSIYKIKINQPAEIAFPSIPDRRFNGTVKRISPGVNMQSQTFPVQVEINNPVEILADSLYGEATITVGKHRNVFVVPVKAVIHNEENDTYYITLINPDSIAHTLNVNTGIKKDSLMEIYAGGLKEGMQVIVEGNYGLPDSTRVSLKK